MKITDGVEMLEISGEVMGKPSVINPVLLWDGDNVILVDAGFPGQLEKFCEAIEGAGVPFEKVNRVILTHQDIDHIGGLKGILKALPQGAEVISHKVEKPYIQGDKTPTKVAQLEAKLDVLPDEMKKMYEILKAGFQSCKTRVDNTLTDGEELPYCGGITVIFTPGHTPGHICLYLKRSKILVAGDILGVEEGRLVKSPQSINYDENLNIESLKKLTGYDIETVIAYHGGLFRDNPNRRISELAEGKE